MAAAKPAFTLSDLVPSVGREIVFPPFEELTMLIYGHQGSGKTSLFGRAGCALILSTEPGARFQKDAAVREITHFSAFGERKGLDFTSMVDGVLAAHAEGKLRSRGVKIVTIDTVDRLHQLAVADVCERNQVAEIGDIPYGKGYSLALNAVRNQVRRLASVIPVQFISHAMTATEEVENETGIKKEVEKLKPSCDRRVAEWLAGEVNLVGYAYKSPEGKFLVKFHSDSRLDTKDRTGLLEAYRRAMPMEWATIVAAYNAKAAERGITLKSKWG